MRCATFALICFALCTGTTAASATDQLCGHDFASVEQLFAELQRTPGITPLPGTDKFVALSDPRDKRVWNLVRAPHPAAPALVCRTVVQDGPRLFYRTEAKCFGPDAACRNLMDEYRALDATIHDKLAAQTQR